MPKAVKGEDKVRLKVETWISLIDPNNKKNQGTISVLILLDHPSDPTKFKHKLNKLQDSKAPKAEGRIEVTGNLGDVMKESVRIGYTFAKVFHADRSGTDDNQGCYAFRMWPKSCQRVSYAFYHYIECYSVGIPLGLCAYWW